MSLYSLLMLDDESFIKLGNPLSITYGETEKILRNDL